MNRPPAPMPNGAVPRLRPTGKSDAVWSATPPASSTDSWRPTHALTQHRWHVSGTPSARCGTLAASVLGRELEEVPMAIVGGLDIHRRQITYDWIDTDTGETRRGQLSPATRLELRAWLEQIQAHRRTLPWRPPPAGGSLPRNWSTPGSRSTWPSQ